MAPFDNADSSPTGKASFPREAAVYYAGRVIEHLGAFTDVIYSGPDNALSLDVTDIRYALPFNWGPGHFGWGLTLNNAPAMQDLWNTTPVWGYPFATSDVAPLRRRRP
ncbi:MAG: hypothetical protein KQJ78_21035 [Deltaproteobacteria bacterium]|nr:hypothetical protein [Deltaproteobacteria bacterium]